MARNVKEEFESFQTVYRCGLKDIAVARAPQESDAALVEGQAVTVLDKRIESTAKLALKRLRATPYGKLLRADDDLCSLYDNLERGLQRETAALEGTLPERSSPSARVSIERARSWCRAPHHKAERAFLFWGRIGAVLHAYRDLGLSLNTEEEAEACELIRERVAAAIESVESLVLNAIVQVAYAPAVLDRIQRQLESLGAFSDVMASPPRLPADELGPNPFHKSYGIIRNQFIRSVSRLCFELFGHLDHHALARLLDIKCTTASALGLLPWHFLKPWRAGEDEPHAPPLKNGRERRRGKAEKVHDQSSDEWGVWDNFDTLVMHPLQGAASRPASPPDWVTRKMADPTAWLQTQLRKELAKVKRLAKTHQWATQAVIEYVAAKGGVVADS